ncbi:MAG: amidohydrolase family protein [Prolixibacteraceae bacterium]
MAFFSFITNAQVQIRPLPSSGYEKRIIDFIDGMQIVDTHEHLLSQTELKQRTALDFMVLLNHYSADDIKSAGMSDRTFKLLLKDSLSAIEKWQILKPYWEGSSNTSYNRVALLAADKLFNIKDINESTVTELSEKIGKAYQSDWINKIIEKCKIDFLIQMNPGRSSGNERFRYVKWFDDFISINSKQKINSIARQQNISIQTLDEFAGALETSFKKANDQGIIALKSGLAYFRILYYENVSKERAQEVFNTIMNNPGEKSLSFTDVKPLQDYIMHRVLDLAKTYKIPVIIHTGLQSGNGAIIENSNPTHLVNLFQEYPDVNFVLLHGGYPYGGETATIAKYFRNVYLDLAWIYAISPSFSERYLHEWLETVPASKIMGFGGDYLNIENVYAHLLFAKQIVSRVLTDKVKDGYFSESEAKNIARMILHDNAVNFYKLAR